MSTPQVAPTPPPPMALLVHEASVRYVDPVVAFIRQQLALHSGREPIYGECSDVATARVPAGSVVFVVGDGFPPYVRQHGCRYVFVNFSLLRRLRWWRPVAPATARWMGAKRRALLARCRQYDLVLDFNPRQTRLLERDLAACAVPVRTFQTSVSATDAGTAAIPLAQRRWDVCFTGTQSTRRTRMRSLLERRGITVSPGVAPGLQTVIGDCRIVANVHFAACDTLEAPRIVHTLAAGACLVTEGCHGLADLVPPSCCVCVPYRRMPGAIDALLHDPVRMAALARAGADYMQMHHAPRAEACWHRLVLQAMAL